MNRAQKNPVIQRKLSTLSRHRVPIALLFLVASWSSATASFLSFKRKQTMIRRPMYSVAAPEAKTEDRSREMADEAPPKEKKFSGLFFAGESSAELELDAPAESVQEWLLTPASSDRALLGATKATQDPTDPSVWDCQQPRIDFMGLALQPSFVHRLERRRQKLLGDRGESPMKADGDEEVASVTVHILDSRTEIVDQKKSNRANQLVAGFMGHSKFSGRSLIWAKACKDSASSPRCKLSIHLRLQLRVPLPAFVPLPPGFNALGSALVSRTGKARTAQVLQDLKSAYQEWEQSQEDAAPSRQPIDLARGGFRRIPSPEKAKAFLSRRLPQLQTTAKARAFLSRRLPQLQSAE